MPEHESTSSPLSTTRESLHRVAEHVLSAALKRATGRIALRPGPGGVRTPPLDDEGRVLALVGTDIALLVGAEVTRRAALTTVREAAEAVGVEAGFPWTTYPPGTPFRPDERLSLDPDAAETLAQWFALGDRALSLLARRRGRPTPSRRSTPSTSTSPSASTASTTGRPPATPPSPSPTSTSGRTTGRRSGTPSGTRRSARS